MLKSQIIINTCMITAIVANTFFVSKVFRKVITDRKNENKK